MAKPDLPPAAALRAFVLAARQERLHDAATALGVTPSAVSHQIRALEEWVGAALFERSPRQVRLTPLGRRLAADLAIGFERIDGALGAARAGAVDRHLKVSTLPLFASTWLIPRLGAFEACYPGLRIEIETSNRVVDLGHEGVDVAIRNVPKPGGELVSRKLLDLTAVPLCRPDVAARIRGVHDLAHVPLIHLSVGPHGWGEWLAAAGAPGLTSASNLAVDTLPAAIRAAVAGHGVMLGVAPLIWDAPDVESLVAPFSRPRPTAGAYFVVHRRQDRSRHVVRAFVDWIVEAMRADQRRLAGRARTRERRAVVAGL